MWSKLHPDVDNNQIPVALDSVSGSPLHTHPALLPPYLLLLFRQPYLLDFQSGKSLHETTSPVFPAGVFKSCELIWRWIRKTFPQLSVYISQLYLVMKMVWLFPPMMCYWLLLRNFMSLWTGYLDYLKIKYRFLLSVIFFRFYCRWMNPMNSGMKWI